MPNRNLINNFVSAKSKFSTNIRDAESTCDMSILYIMIVGGGSQGRTNLGDIPGGNTQLRGFNVGGATTASQLQMRTALGNTSSSTGST
jgi:hypothetical protein